MHDKKVTIDYLHSQKNVSKLTMITAYDALFANIFDGHADMILVGDSLEMSFMGESDTLKATMDSMIYHTKAVCNGAKNSYIITDMPFGSIPNKDEALKNATRVYKETLADAVKIEATAHNLDIIEHIVKNGIAVVGHIGLIPQNSRFESGYHVKGRDGGKELLNLALSLDEIGVNMLVVEGVIDSVAKEITSKVKVPVIGIGSGVDTDGQVLVWSDMFGFYDKFKPKFVKRFLNGKELVQNALKEYISEVKNEKFPSDEHIYKK
ncbi:MAG: 3-methyl-2-oxobutanoate hydroxymethyltransferase [Campylobacteraceae bacterium]|nr:3-methyl-2-oxobutanoate hydroxymethyltransferase [Campylobacteraceae bacterium]